MAYGPGLWRWFGLTVITVWEIDIAQFYHAITYIDRQEAKEAADGRN